MIYAQIKNGIVENIIVLNDENLKSLFLVGFDFLIKIDGLNPSPGVGWHYDGENFANSSEENGVSI